MRPLAVLGLWWVRTLGLATALTFGAVAWAQPPTCGVVLMHGKWGMPKSPYLKTVVRQLETVCQVQLLEMPWSKNRLYDRPYADALQQISQAVTQLRQAGVQWVALGGQSFGANASLAYMAQVGDVDALLPLSPGHVPEVFYQMRDVRRSVDQAREAIAAGQGERQLALTDANQGQRRDLLITANALWSYFNPQGWGNMALSAQNARKAVPVFWAIGTLDPLHGAASEHIYQQLPPHPDSLYMVVHATHASAPEVASDGLLTWVKARTGR